MKTDISPGKYILAVSGGVDSMVLLDLLSRKPGVELVIAHFNHGIRSDSNDDENLVREVAERLKLSFESGRGQLGPKASEDKARQARYAFLEETRLKHQAEAILTAHHQDDLIETALINILRGTGWRGLTSIQNREKLLRPLLNVTKKEIISYARAQKLKWREDSTNQNEKYLRNYLRLKIIPKLSSHQRRNLLSKIDNVANIKKEHDRLIATISQLLMTRDRVQRAPYRQLPRPVSSEVLMTWLRERQIGSIDSKTVTTLDLKLRSSPAGRQYPVNKQWRLVVGSQDARLVRN